MQDLKRISDIVPSGALYEAERIDLGEILNKDVLISDFQIRPGNFGEFAIILIALEDGQQRVVVTGAQAVVRKLKAAAGQQPFLARFVQRRSTSGRRYYDLE